MNPEKPDLKYFRLHGHRAIHKTTKDNGFMSQCHRVPHDEYSLIMRVAYQSDELAHFIEDQGFRRCKLCFKTVTEGL